MKKLLTLGMALVVAVTVVAQIPRLRVHNFTTRDGMASNVVNCGLQDRQGYIWLGTNHGLTRFDGHRFANFYIEENGNRQIEGITDIAEDTTNNVLLLAGKGYRLLAFDLQQMQFVSAEGMKFPRKAEKEKKEQTYMARAASLGINRGNKTNRRHDLHYAQLEDGRELFATIDNGFYIFNPKTSAMQHYCATDSQPVIETDYINGVMKDGAGGVWLLTTFAGVYRLETGEGPVIYHDLVPNIRSFSQLSDQQIAVADMEGNVYNYNPDTRQNSLIFNKGVRAYAISTDSKERLWIGTRGDGVWILAGAQGAEARKIENLPARQIYDIKFSQSGTVWIASLDGGLIEGHEQADGSFLFFPHLQNQGVHEIDIDELGRLWVATENGILMKDGQKTDTIFSGSKVVCVCHAPNGVVWAGSNGHGLLRIEDRKVSFVQADDGLANNCVESVVCDSEGNVIAGTDQGISIVSSIDGTVRNIYSSQGLRANTYNENAILCTTDGRLLLGSLTGLVELTQDAIGSGNHGKTVNSRSPQLTCIDINDRPRYDLLTDEIRLTHDQNTLCFSFSSFAYKDMASVIYSYWLEGIDSDWRPSTKESRALYTNLLPGHYRLHMRSRLAGTQWSEETVCDVYIAQPWYWTWWARSLYILLFVLLVLYELHQYQQRLSLRRQLDQRLAVLYAATPHSAPEGATIDPGAETIEAPSGAIGGASEAPVPQKEKDFLDKLDRLISENLLQTDLDVNFLASEMCMSYSTLHRRLKSLTGMTANEYVRKHRLAKAMQLLHDGHNATEVSMLCGFNSPSYFTRCFKAEYGIPPSEVK